MGVFLAVTRIPNKALLVASKVERSPNQTVIGLIFSVYLTFDAAFGLGRHPFENQHTTQSIGTVHEAGGTLQNLHRSHFIGVYLDAVLVAPLLAFLTDAVVDDYDAVVAQSTNDGLGDAAACGNLRHAWLFGDGID